MILTQERKDVEVSGNFESVAMTAKIGAKAFDIFSNKIYSKKIEAVIRELACNAHDSHIEAGNPDPYIVHLPTMIEPWLGFRDYGVGMSHSKIMSQYSTYFDSDKDGNNDVIGCLGIGSKSPFCLVDSFTVIAFDGVTQRVYTIYKDENNMPSIALLSETDSDEPTGIEVRMDIDGRFWEFEEDAYKVFRYFDKLPTINKTSVIEKIEEFKSKTILEGANYRIIDEEYHGLKIVMGNVAYSVPSEANPMGINGMFFVGPGEISFDPGREKVELDNRTKEVVKKLQDDFLKDVIDDLQAEADTYPSPLESVFFVKGKNFGSSKLNDVIRKPVIDGYGRIKTTDGVSCYVKHSWKNIAVNEFDTIVPCAKTTKYVNTIKGYTNAIRNFVKDKGTTVVYLNPEQVKELGVSDALFTPIEAFDSYKTQSTRQKTGSVYLYNGDKYAKDHAKWDECNDVPSGRKVYVKISRYEPIDGFGKLNTFAAYFTNVEVYGVKKQFAESKRFNKKEWISLDDYVKEQLSGSYTDYSISYSNQEFIERMAEISTRSIFREKLNEIRMMKKCPYELKDVLRKFGIKIQEKCFDSEIQDLISEYPMLKYVPSSSLKNTDVTNYIKEVEKNAVH